MSRREEMDRRRGGIRTKSGGKEEESGAVQVATGRDVMSAAHGHTPEKGREPSLLFSSLWVC